MHKVYRNLLRLYPASHREQFGEEMIAMFAELHTEAARQGVAARVSFCGREFAGIVAGALKEHLRAALCDEVWLVFPARRFTMRTEFRFPKATAVLMTIILAGVVMTIQRGEAIQASLPNVNPPIGPIQPVHSTLLPGVVVLMAIFYVVGLIGWVILFALRRSGVHRLAATSADLK
jgi:hypothetical protein